MPTRFVLCTQDRFFPEAFMRRVVAERLGVVPDEIEAGHCVALSRPREWRTFSSAMSARSARRGTGDNELVARPSLMSE